MLMTSLAQGFLDRFKAAEQIGSPLHLFVDDVPGFAAAIADLPGAFGGAIEAAAKRTAGSIADLVRGSFASAACDKSGTILVADPSFRAWLQGPDPLSTMVRGISTDKPHVSMIADDATGRPIAIAAGSRAITGNWPLDTAVRKMLDSKQADYAVIACRPSDVGWERAGGAYNLSPAETRLVAALARCGELKQAATSAGIAYETARKMIAEVMVKTGSRRQTDLVRKLVSLAAGDLSTPDNVTALFAELFGLTLGQARLTRTIALGTTRDQAAELLGVSANRTKTDLKAVFTACGVTTAVDLSRIVAEVDVLAGLATACDVEISIGNAVAQPLRLIRRGWADGQLSISDFGPKSAIPVLIFNSALMGRSISPTLIAALQRGGFRPISFDRAGYGLSDSSAENPWVAAARDVACILDALSIDRALIFARGGSHAVMATAASLPTRIVGGVLQAPDSPSRFDSNWHLRSLIAQGRLLLFGNPFVVENFAKLMSRRANSAVIEKLLRGSVANSPIDLAVLNTPAELRAMVRSARQSAINPVGFAREILAMPHADPQAIPDGRNWTLIYGGKSPMYLYHEISGFWRATLPGITEICVADGGHYLHASHSAEIVTALQRLVV